MIEGKNQIKEKDLKTTVIGAFPKVSDEMGGQELRRTLHQFDREEISRDVLNLVYDETTAAAIDEMEKAGIDVVNDGQIRWDDLFAPFANAWKGVSRGPLERFYDNNTYFRQPVITGPIRTDGQNLVSDFKFAQQLINKIWAKKSICQTCHRPYTPEEEQRNKPMVKAAVCGPLTFATLAIDQYYGSFEDLLAAVTVAVARETQGLRAAGATLIEAEDPAVVARPELIDQAKQSYELLRSLGVKVALTTYFFPADPVIETLAELPVSQIGIDVRSRETNVLEKLGNLKQTVVLGVVDARNTKVESAGEVADIILEALKVVPADRLWVSPTTSLEYLPHDVAVAKLHALHNGVQLAGALYHG